MPAIRSRVLMTRHAVAIFLLGILANVSLTVAMLIKLVGPVVDVCAGKGKAEDWSWRLGCWTADKLWRYMQNHFENTLHASPCVTFSGDVDKIRADEGAVVIANHQGYADYYLVHALASRCSTGGKDDGASKDMLPNGQSMLGKCRYFAKKDLVWQVPVFGWSMWAIGMILISRNWTSDAALIEQAFARVKHNRHPAWIVSYLEGTRLSRRKIRASQDWAREQNKPIMSKVLYPRTKGFVCTIRALRSSHIRHVYDLTLSYKAPSTGAVPAETRPLIDDKQSPRTESVGRTPSLDELLSVTDLAAAGYSFHVDVRRIAIDDLPNEEEDLKDWVEQAWRRKEALLLRWHGEEVITPMASQTKFSMNEEDED